jgi:hypothetical protein
MSTTGPQVVLNVQALLQESSPDDPVVPVDIYPPIINRMVSMLAGPEHLNIGSAWVSPILTLVAGTDEYELQTGVEYEQVLSLCYATDRVPLRKESLDTVSLLWTGTTKAQGRPRFMCLRPEPDQHIKVMVWPCPTAGEAVNGLVTLAPTPWVSTATAPSIPFSARATMALELLVASAIGKTLGTDKATALGLNPACFDGWKAEALELVRQERLSVIRLKRSYGANNCDWVQAWSC